MYNEDIQDRAAQLMVEAGLPQGRILVDGTDVIYNAIVESKEDGPFWYGDLESNDLPKLVDVATILGKELMAQAEPNALGFRSMEIMIAVPKQ